LQQLLLNLAAHARECLPDGGTLTLSTALVEVAAGTSRHADARAGAFVRLTARDTGCGFDAEALARLFEPFASALPEGASSGLGLATLPAIVKQHGGWIEVSSQPRRGTTFDIYLPVTSQAETPEAPDNTPLPGSRSTTPDSPAAAGKVLLLVEDDRDVRGVTRQILKQSGCQILEAGNALEALRLWPQYRGRVDLLVTDLRLPHGIDGRELARRLKAEDPRLRVLYTSGRGTEAGEGDTALRGDTAILAKPYNSGSLLSAVNACFAPDAASLQP
jgi:CheY-like chemotaxis protein